MEEYVVKRGEIFLPSRELKEIAWVTSKRIYKDASRDPLSFWSGFAEELAWFRRWRRIYWERLPHYSWFIGGEINACFNCVDRHYATQPNKVAIYWEPEEQEEREKKITYAELFREVNEFASTLKSLGVRRGDRVVIYMPVVPEVIIAMLACARIGAIHSVVFSAFSSEALRTRILDADAKLLVTCDHYYRRGKTIDLLSSAREGVKGTRVKKVLVVPRKKKVEVELERNEVAYNEIRKEVRNKYCEPTRMKSEDLLFILYTSGCCSGDTLIQLEDGRIETIKEVVEGSNTSILAYDFRRDVPSLTEIKGKYGYYYPLYLVRVETQLGELKTTPNHPFFVLTESGEIEEKLACALEAGDILIGIRPKLRTRFQPLPRVKQEKRKERVPKLPRRMNRGFARILGYIAGKGSVRDGVVRVNDRCVKNLKLYKRLVERTLKLKGKIEEERGRLQLFNEVLSSYLRENFPEVCRRSFERDVPIIIQTSPNGVVASFIRGLFDARASLENCVKFVTRSERLARKLLLLLLRFGILANLNEIDARGRSRRVAYEVKIVDGSSLRKYAKFIGFSDPQKKRKLEELVEQKKRMAESCAFDGLRLKGLVREAIYFVPIKKVELVENEEKFVYDLTTEASNYVANGILVHNTTGMPKGIMHSTAGYLVQAYATAKLVFDLHDFDVFFSTADIGWITGHTYSCYGPLANGASLVIYEGAPDYPDCERIWQIIEKYGVTIFYTAPTLIRMLMMYGDEHVKKYEMETLRILASVGEPIDRKAWMWFFEQVGKRRCPIIDTWWQTETGGTLINTLPGIGPFVPTVAGLPFPGTRWDVFRDDGKPARVGEEGELVALSPFAPGMLRGIWRNEARYVKAYWSRFPNVYLSEDRAVKLRGNLIKILGRSDDVMKVAGHRLSTAELENAIASHPAVAECCVVGMSHEIKGEVPVAFVVLKHGAKASPDELTKLVEKKIGKIARPAAIYFVSSLPHTRSGKIMRRLVRKILHNEELGDTSTLLNPESLEEIRRVIKQST